jgi:hypothetical protein
MFILPSLSRRCNLVKGGATLLFCAFGTLLGPRDPSVLGNNLLGSLKFMALYALTFKELAATI